MRSFYAACDLAAESGRVLLGSLYQDKLTLSEIRHFSTQPVQEKDSLLWNIPQVFEEILAGLHAIGAYDEAVESVACTSWSSDYLLFEADGSLIAPTFHHRDRRSVEGMQRVLAKISSEAIYAETGLQQRPASTLFQLAAEKSRRLGKAIHLLPVADALNYLLAGVARVELSSACGTQLFNPVSQNWSTMLPNVVGLPAKLLPPVVPAGTAIGPLRKEVIAKTALDDTRVVASCSNELAAAIAGLPVGPDETWAFLRTGSWSVMGTEVAQPMINETTRRANFSNELGYGGATRLSKQIPGLWLLEECRRFWKEKDREIDQALLTHLAGSSPPFEALINPADPRLLTPGDMPLKIQAICRETNQVVPRKPGPFIRCILESLALLYRRTLRDMEQLTGRKITKLYLLGGSTNDLLNRFIANAVHCAVVVAPPEVTSIGNIIIQARTAGHVKSAEHAREVIQKSLKVETLIPHAAAWDVAHARLDQLFPA